MEIKKKTNAKGITLIALVVTIVVLLILAGVSINLVLGNNGIITKAKEARTEAHGAEVADARELWMGEREISKATGQIQKTMEAILAELQTKGVLSTEEVQTIKNNPNNEITIGSRTISFKEPVDVSKLKVGDYVNYTYDAVSAGAPLPAAVSGADSDQTIKQPETAIKWRILNINDDGTIDLISEKEVDTPVIFKGALGYNNGVYALNDICAKLYSNKNLGVTARSINLEDIEKQETPAGTKARKAYTNSDSNTQYGSSKTYTTNLQYPLLYAKEIGSGVNTTTPTQPANLDIADPYKTSSEGYKKEELPTTETSGTANADPGLTVTQTYYWSDFTTAKYGAAADLFKTTNYYWVASRRAYCGSGGAGFGLRRASSDLGNNDLFNSSGGVYAPAFRLRPVVSLNSNIIDTEGAKDASGAWNLRVQ